MSQMANITLADGQTTPVNHTFQVVTAQNGDIPAGWRDAASYSTVVGQYKASLLVKRNSTSDKVSIRIYLPGMSTDGTQTKLHTTLASMDFVMPDTADLQQRKDVLAFAKNILAQAITQDAVHNGSPAY